MTPRHYTEPRWGLGVQPPPPFKLLNFLELCICKNAVQALLMLIKSQNFAQKDFKNCTLTAHLLKLLGTSVTQNHYSGFAPAPHWGTFVPTPLVWHPFRIFLDPPLQTPSIVKSWVYAYAPSPEIPIRSCEICYDLSPNFSV